MSTSIIDLRSDTVTQPTRPIRKMIYKAQVGDDAYGEDPANIELKEYCQDLFGVEDSLFVTSGMLANRLAICTQLQAGDELIVHRHNHINFFDSAPMSALFGCVFNVVDTPDGVIEPPNLNAAIQSKHRFDYFAQPKLVAIENTISGLSGKIYPFSSLERLRAYTQEIRLNLHLDGARLFNAHVATGIPLKVYATQVDTLSVCFSKGLGAPFGSMLMGKRHTIEKARKFKVWLGSGYHQIGFMAAAALYALKHHISRLKDDHAHALALARGITDIDEIFINLRAVETNIVIMQLKDIDDQQFIRLCKEQGLLLFSCSPGYVRAITHLNIRTQDIKKAINIIKNVVHKLCKNSE